MRQNDIPKHGVLDHIFLIFFFSVKPTRSQTQERHHSSIDRNNNKKDDKKYMVKAQCVLCSIHTCFLLRKVMVIC